MYKNMNNGNKSITNFQNMPNLHTNCHFQNIYLKLDHHIWGKWFTHGSDNRKENQLTFLLIILS